MWPDLSSEMMEWVVQNDFELKCHHFLGLYEFLGLILLVHAGNQENSKSCTCSVLGLPRFDKRVALIF